MKTITLTNEQAQELEDGGSITIQAPKKPKWEPIGGEFIIDCDGEIYTR
jgi:hypothetical protein